MRLAGIGDEAAAGLAEQIRIHRELGFSGLELRTIAGQGIHELTDGQADELVTAIADAGLTVPAIDTPIGNWGTRITSDPLIDLEILTCTAKVAQLLGCRLLRIMSYPNDGLTDGAWGRAAIARIGQLVRVAEDLGVVLIHENCHGWAGQSALHSVMLLDAIDSPSLRLLFDVGNGIAYGYDSADFLRQVLQAVVHVHVKDGQAGQTGPVFGLPGEGECHVASCVTMLTDAGYDGWFSLEPHVAHIPHLGVSSDPTTLSTGYRACAESFRKVLDA